MGFCQSYDQTWKDIEAIADQELEKNKAFFSKNLDKIQVVADNLNISVGVNHQRIGHNLDIRNYTAAFVMILPKIPYVQEDIGVSFKTTKVQSEPRNEFEL